MNSRFSSLARRLVCLAVMLHGASPLWAQGTPDVFVVSVGIDQYQPPTNSLQGCVNDAAGMAKLFRSQEGGSFGKVQVQLLTNANATEKEITKSLQWLSAQGKAGDWYAIVLSGHGAITRDQWTFLSQDNRNLPQTDLLELADRLAQSGKKVLILIDACHAGQIRYAASAMLNRHSDSTKGGIILMVSSMTDQLSAALGSYSAFARAVEEGLSGLADYDGDEAVTLQELRRFTFNRVYELRLQKRLFPGLPVDHQDSAIDTSLSIPESTRLTRGKKPPQTPSPDDGPETDRGVLSEATWTTTLQRGTMPPLSCEFKFDPFGYYRATLREGSRVLRIGMGAYKTHEKVVTLHHHQAVDRLQIESLTPSRFRYRFQGQEFDAVAGPTHGPLLLDVTDRLAQQDPRDRLRKDSPHKVLPVHLEGGSTYIFHLMSPDFDAYLRLEDPQGFSFAENDDGGDGRDARLATIVPTTGVYRVIVTTFRGGYGAYHLHIERVGGTGRPPVAPPIGTGEIALSFRQGGASAADRLTSQDPLDSVRKGAYRKVYLLPLEARRRYSIILRSDEFDPYLRLEDPSGRALAFSLGMEPDRTAQLTHVAASAGLHRLIVTSRRDHIQGSFTLKVQSAPP